MPPDLFGNMHASSAWMLFCSAPKVIEIVQRTNAPVVPSAPIDEPNAAMRKPGFASATTKPSHHVMALSSCLSYTSAPAISPLPIEDRAALLRARGSCGLYQFVHWLATGKQLHATSRADVRMRVDANTRARRGCEGYHRSRAALCE